MKTNRRKGFTLVELLVVIAILAILATVSVVGYTSFIERAYVSNDENIATQLNNYLVAIKADSNGEFYGEDIDENNIRLITEKILAEGGLEGLVPQSLDYGYNFYYDLKDGKYVVKKDRDVQTPAFNVIFGAFADNSDYEVKLENSFTQGNRYFFVGTPNEKNPMSMVVDQFYKFDETNYADLKTLVESVESTALEAYVNSLVVVTDDCNYRLGETQKYVLFVNGVKILGTTTQKWNGNGWDGVEIDDSYILATDAKFTVPNSVEFIAGDSLNVGGTSSIKLNKTAAEVAKMACENFTNTTITLKDGVYSTADKGVVGGPNADKAVIYNESIEWPLEYYNPATSYEIAIGENGELVHNSNTGFANVAVEADTFVLSSTNFVGSIYPNLPSSTTSADVVWTLADGSKENAYVKIEGNVVKIKATTTDPIKFIAKLDGVEDKTYTVYLAYISTGSLKLFDDILTLNGTIDLTLVKTPTTSKYVIEKNGDYTVHNNEGVTLNDAITWTYEGTGTTKTSGTTEIELSGKGAGVLTIKVGSYLTFTVNLTIEDTANFALQPLNNNNFTYLGSKNEAYLSDFFTLNGELPEGAELVVFSGGSFSGDTYMTPNRTELQTSGNGVSIKYYSRYNLDSVSTAEDLEDIKLEFVGEDKNNAIRMAVMHNGVRISEDIIVKVVDAYNVREYSDMKSVTTDVISSETKDGHNGTEGSTSKTETSAVDANGFKTTTVTTTTIEHQGYGILSKKKTITTVTVVTTTARSGYNFVLLDNIVMAGTYDVDNKKDLNNGTFTIPKDTTFYGNGFTFDISKHGRKSEEGIINLEGTLKDVKVTGAVYKSTAYSAGNDEGSASVRATGGAIIENCYISNSRAPLRVNSGIVIVKNTVLFGGRYCNIDIVGGTLKIQGTVVTVQTPVKYDNKTTVLGAGIVCWYNDNVKAIVIDTGADLKQYNFATQAQSSILPSINMSGANLLDITAVVGNAFADPQWEDMIYDKVDNGNGNYGGYANIGIIGIEKYITYPGDLSISVDETKDAEENVTGTTATVSVNRKHYTTMYTLIWDKNVYKLVTKVDANGVPVEFDETGMTTFTHAGSGTTVAEAGVIGTHTLVLKDGATPNTSSIKVAAVEALNVSGLSNSDYVRKEYPQTAEDWQWSALELACSLTGDKSTYKKGLNNKSMITDWWTTKNTYKTEYNEFISDGFAGYYGTSGQSGEGEYTFVNGKVHFYTLPTE